MMLAIIGGSGLTQIPGLAVSGMENIVGPYGELSAPLVTGILGDSNIVFLARHGRQHSIAPHEINYRANIWGLKAVGVTRIVSVATVGGIGAGYLPGLLAVPHQIIDYTTGRAQTFFGDGERVQHVDFTEPYSYEVRSEILHAAERCREPVIADGVYAVTQGPRLETAAEINRLEHDGADIVGMTAMPEAILAREAGIPYASLAVVANFAAGRGDSRNGVDLEAIQSVHRRSMQRVVKILESVVEGPR